MSRPAAAKALLLSLLAALPAGAKDGRKIFVSVDMEGIDGVATEQQLGPTGFEYAAAREWMTQEANTAIAAAREAGATEFVVADSHGSMQNLLPDKLPPDVQLVRGTPRPLGGAVDTATGELMVVDQAGGRLLIFPLPELAATQAQS